MKKLCLLMCACLVMLPFNVEAQVKSVTTTKKYSMWGKKLLTEFYFQVFKDEVVVTMNTYEDDRDKKLVGNIREKFSNSSCYVESSQESMLLDLPDEKNTKNQKKVLDVLYSLDYSSKTRKITITFNVTSDGCEEYESGPFTLTSKQRVYIKKYSE